MGILNKKSSKKKIKKKERKILIKNSPFLSFFKK